MRIWERLKILVPILLALLPIAETSAQQMGGYQPAGAPAFMAGQQHSAPAYQGMPQSFQSHPAISPFDHAMEQTFNSDGLWFKRFLSGMENVNDYYLNVDYIKTRARSLEGRIGHPNAPTFVQDGTQGNSIVGTAGLPDALFLEPFPAINANVTGANTSGGIRLRGGLENRLGWSFNWNVFYGGEHQDVVDYQQQRANSQLHFFDAVLLEASGGVANGQLPTNLRHTNEFALLQERILNRRVFDNTSAEDFGIAGTTEDILDRNLFPYASLPIINPNEPAAPIFDPFGTAMIFDLYFSTHHTVETFGTGAHFGFSPMYEEDSFRIRAVAGGRFFRVNESWGFRGGDSGLAYTFSQPDGLDDDDDFIVDNVEENGTLDFTAIIDDGSQQILVRSFTNAQVRSTMGGPEIGLEYLVGEKKGISVTGHTKVGAMFNTERASLQGDNIGNTLRTQINAVTGVTERTELFDTSTDINPTTENFFSDSQTSTHVSPMFEQSLHAEIPIFSRLPVFKDIWQLEHAKIRLGWSYLLIGEVADPSQSINWVTNPRAGIFPNLNINRSTFHQNTLSAGIQWEL